MRLAEGPLRPVVAGDPQAPAGHDRQPRQGEIAACVRCPDGNEKAGPSRARKRIQRLMPRREKDMDPVVHFEMPYDNRDRMAKFYRSVFAWDLQMMGEEMGNYVLAKT